MTLINLLVVSIREDWRPLIVDSLGESGYESTIEYADNKQSAIKLCHEHRFDLLICGCSLPDGTVADLANVLGSRVPCLVMSEGQCPMGNGRALSLLATNFYITHADKNTWLAVMKTTMLEWESRTRERIRDFENENSNLYASALRAVKRELVESPFTSGKPDVGRMEELCLYLTEVLDVSQASFYRRIDENDRQGDARLVSYAVSPGVGLIREGAFAPKMELYPRWHFLLSHQLNVFSPFAVITDDERVWLDQRSVQSLIAVPICDGGAWQFFLLLEDLISPRKWSSSEIEFLNNVGNLIGGAYRESLSDIDREFSVRRLSAGG